MKTSTCLPAFLLSSVVASGALADDDHLSFYQTLTGGTNGCAPLKGAEGIAIASASLSTTNIYVTGHDNDSISTFGWDVYGQLVCMESKVNNTGGVTGLNGATGVVVAPDGRNVYVAGAIDDSVVSFLRGTDGSLSFQARYNNNQLGVVGLNDVRSVAVDLAGAYVFSAGFADDSVATFRRDPGNGALTFLGRVKDNVGMADGLNGAIDVVVSPQNDFVYVAGYADDAIAVFALNQGAGTLSFQAAVHTGLNGPRNLALSPNGQYLAAASYVNDSVVLFERDAATGLLSYSDSQWDGMLDPTSGTTVDGLNGAWDVAFSYDGSLVYVASYLDDAVSVFHLDAPSGTLSYVGMERDGVDDLDDEAYAPDGLNGLRALAVGPMVLTWGVFTASANEDALSVFWHLP